MPTLLSAENRRYLIDLMADLPNLRARSTREATLYRADLARHARQLHFDATPLDFCTELVQRLEAANTLPPLFDYLITDEFPGRPDVIPFLRGLLPAEHPPAPMDCYVDTSGIDLDETDYRLLSGAAVLSRISLVQQLGEGRSGARVFLADIAFAWEGDRDFDGYAFIKLDKADHIEAEMTKHESARRGIEPYAPQILAYLKPVGGRAGLILEPATRTTLSALSLAKLLQDGEKDVVGAIGRLCEDVLPAWNAPADLARTRQSRPAHAWLLAAFHCASQNPASRDRELAAMGLPISNDRASFNVYEFDNLRLPNPVAYALKMALWSPNKTIFAPMGRVHGDPNAANLICRSDEENLPAPWLIDFARHVPEDLIFFDLAYLELDILLRLLSGHDWKEWGELLKSLFNPTHPKQSIHVAPGNRHSFAVTAYRHVEPIRKHVATVITAAPNTQTDNFWAAWWLAAAGVGLLLARREAYADRPERMMAFLYAAAALDNALSILGVPIPPDRHLYTLELDPIEEALPFDALRDAEIAYAAALGTKLEGMDHMYVELGGVQAEEQIGTVPLANPLHTPLRTRRERNTVRLEFEYRRGGVGKPVPSVPVAMREGRIVLLGEPGAGKTWTLRRLALDYAADLAKHATAPIPVFVPLARFRVAENTFADFVKAQLADPDLGLDTKQQDLLTKHFDDLLKAGRLILLCDALNEMPRDAEGKALQSLQDFLNTAQRVAVSCRARDFEQGSLANAGRFTQITIRDLTPPQIKQIIRHYLYRDERTGQWTALSKAQRKGLWAVELKAGEGEGLLRAWAAFAAVGQADTFWQGDPTEEVEGYYIQNADIPEDKRAERLRYRGWWRMPDPFDADMEIHKAMREDTRALLALCCNPFMLYVVIEIYRTEGKLPPARGALFQEFADILIGREIDAAARREEPWPEGAEGALKTALSALAEAMQLRQNVTDWPKTDALPILKGEERLKIAIQCSLLQDMGQTVRFAHQLLQEYFASEAMARDMAAGISASTYWPPEKWWETTKADQIAMILAGAAYAKGTLPNVLKWLGTANPKLALDAAIEAVGETLQTAATTLGTEGEHVEVRQILANAHLAKMNPNSGTDLLIRAAIGRSIDTVGDPRPGVGLRPDGLPDIVWCEVPGGPFEMGGNGQYDGKPIHTLEVAAFQIAKYPVTYRQFQAFIDAPDGFNNSEWWAGLHEDGLQQQRGGPGDQVFKFWNHPRERVSWYDAVAFCRWLSRKLGYEVRLPTEAEWEKAARWDSQRSLEYPYGDTYDPTKSNTDETGIKQTSAVGIFPDGAALCGALDMSGNVWEWVSSKYEGGYPYHPDDGREHLAGNVSRGLRGGSWYDLQVSARAACRFWGSPDSRYDDRGFRLFCAVPVSH